MNSKTKSKLLIILATVYDVNAAIRLLKTAVENESQLMVNANPILIAADIVRKWG